MKGLLKVWLFFTLLGGTLLAYAWGGERPRLRMQRYSLSLPGDAGAGLRILHLSDQHFGHDNWVRRSRLRKLERMMADLQPDLVVFTGDFLHNDDGLDAVEQMLRSVPQAPLGRYAVLGNHDYAEYSYTTFFTNAIEAIKEAQSPQGRMQALAGGLSDTWTLFWHIYRNDRLRFAAVPNNTAELKAYLELYNVRLLDNEALALPGHGELWLVGVDDVTEGQPDVERAFAEVPENATTIFLTHNPDLAFLADARNANLALAGHTHGGQVVFPGVGALHTQGTLLDRSHPAGHFPQLPTDNPPVDMQMVVSKGMGESTPFRLRCVPEMVVIDLVPATSTQL